MADTVISLANAASLSDGGEMGAILRAHDWAGSPIGPPQSWPQPLRTLIGVMLSANQPMFLAWGPERTLLYNDAYAEIMVSKHPAALGRDFLEVWHEIRADLAPIVERAYAGQPVRMDDIELRMERRGYPEETHFSFSYTPVRDETGKVEGFLCACVEITSQILSERGRAFRLALEERLRNLDDPRKIMAASLALISEHLGLDRVGYTEVVDDTTVRMTGCHVANGMEPLTGVFPLTSFGEARIARQRQGVTEVCDDVHADPEQDDEVWAAIDTRSFISVPLVREGKLRASLYVNNRSPRRWTPEEVALVEQVATRTWDAVERARSEAALRESEAQFRLMADATPQIIWITDRHGRMEFFNRKFTDYTGELGRQATPAEIAAEFMHPEDGAHVVAAFEAALAGGVPFEVEHRIRSAAGEYRWFLARAEPYRDPQTSEILRWFGASVDIHDRRQAEAELRESEARLRLALDAGQLAEVAFHIDGGGVSHSAPFAELLGHPPEKRLTLAEFRAQYHPEDRDRVLAERAAILDGRQGFYEVRHRIVRPNGEVRWLYGRGSVNRDPQGRAVSVTAVYLDDTERQQTELALRESEARLSFLDRLSAETAALSEADKVLRSTTRLLGEHLGLSVCAYADMDEDEDGFTIRGDWAAPGSTSIVGHYRLADFGKLAVTNLSAGRPLVVNDNLRELAPEEAATFQSIGIAATICMPLVKEGRLTALMAIHDKVPRVWTEEELTLLRDVTARSWSHVERVGALAELRESEAQFRAFAQAVPNHVWAARPDGQVYWFNGRFYAYCGVPRGSLDGADWGRLVHPDDRPAVAAVWVQALASGRVYETEFRLRRADGSFRWFLVRAEPVRGTDGAIVNWVGTNTDIDGRRRAEAKLRELNETLEQRVAQRTRELERIWHNSQDLQVVVDESGVFRAVSPAATRLLGWLPEEMVGRPLFEFSHPDGHVNADEKLAGALTGPTETHLNRYRDKAGNYHWISWITTPADGLIYCSGRDVTAEVERKAELEAAQEALRQSQKMEAMGQLTGGVAHDFNNLLTPIIASLDMLLRRGIGSERERRLMDGALQSAERAKTLVQRLLAFARRQPLQPRPVDVRELVAGMADLVASTSGPRINVRVELPDDLPPALADANQLEMAVLNLAVNARDAMPEGGVLTISAARDSVRGRHPANLRPGHYVRLSVKDTGTGMDEATLACAVEPFFSTKGIGKGTGLGLSMVHGLASQLGGGLAITSRLGQGTSVDLWLSISAVAAKEDGPSSSTAKAPKAQGTALLVDDEDLVRMSTADMLMDLGFEVAEATSAEEALRLIGEGLHPDLVVTDHLMPGMSGVDLARELRSRRPDLPVLIVSGYAEMDGIAPGFPRLPKPFRNAELSASLTNLMSGIAG